MTQTHTHIRPTCRRTLTHTHTLGGRTHIRRRYLLIKWAALLKIYSFLLLWFSAPLSNNNRLSERLMCLIQGQIKSRRMQVRELSDYKKPHQSKDAWRDEFPRLRAWTLLLSVLESRCATRHCGRDMIWRHISLSALTSSPHLAPSTLSSCASVFGCQPQYSPAAI